MKQLAGLLAVTGSLLLGLSSTTALHDEIEFERGAMLWAVFTLITVSSLAAGCRLLDKLLHILFGSRVAFTRPWP